MANYKSQYTGAQIDEAVGKALARVGGYEEPAVMGKLLECTIPAGQESLHIGTIEHPFENDKTYPVTVNGKTYEAEHYHGENYCKSIKAKGGLEGMWARV